MFLINLKLPKNVMLNQQIIRKYATKPRWLPTAKTKVFRVPRRPQVPVDERLELQRITSIYNTRMKAIKYMLESRYLQNVTSQDVIERLKKEEEEDWQMKLAINDEWNETVKKEREERVAEAFKTEKEDVLIHVADLEESEREHIRMIDEIIRAEKERMESFITKDNIDKAIDEALNTTHDFNYCIDMRENIYYGTRGNVSATEKELQDLEKSDRKCITISNS